MGFYIVQHRRASKETWEDEATLIPQEGEIVIELDMVNFLHKFKVGDGIHPYAELAYMQAGDVDITQVLAKARPRVVTVELAPTWNRDAEGKYSQTLALDNITAHSRLDLHPTADMLAEFKQLGLVFVAENHSGVITVYSVGNMPTQAYTMQATIVETECNGEEMIVVGTPVGVPVAQSDWNQADDTKADFIKNKPTLGAMASKDKVEKADLAADVQESLGNTFSGKYEDLENAPEALKNPYSIIFTGAATGEYDGSAELTINIPSGNGGGDVTAHNSDSTAHSDIRGQISQINETIEQMSGTTAPYVHPKFNKAGTYTKVTVNDEGHITEGSNPTTLAGYGITDAAELGHSHTAEEIGALPNTTVIPEPYVLPSAGTELGGVKTGGDVTIENGLITVNDDSHNHTIANVDGLQTALDGKAPVILYGTEDIVDGSAAPADVPVGTLYVKIKSGGTNV
jgi:hypothetical protein